MYELMKSVDEVIENELLPSIIGESIAGKEKELYSLLMKLGIINVWYLISNTDKSSSSG